MSEFLRVERAGAAATIWIDRQAKMNTMTVAMREEFPGLFRGGHVEDQRVERRPFFDLENAAHRFFIEGVGTESIHRFRGKSDQSAAL